MGVAALVLGIVGLLGSMIPLLGAYAILLTALAVIFGFYGMFDHKGRGMAIAGFVCGVIGTLLAVYWIWVARKVATIINADPIELRTQRPKPDLPTWVRDEYERGARCNVAGESGHCLDTKLCGLLEGYSSSGHCIGPDNVMCCVLQDR